MSKRELKPYPPRHRIVTNTPRAIPAMRRASAGGPRHRLAPPLPPSLPPREFAPIEGVTWDPNNADGLLPTMKDLSPDNARKVEEWLNDYGLHTPSTYMLAKLRFSRAPDVAPADDVQKLRCLTKGDRIKLLQHAIEDEWNRLPVRPPAMSDDFEFYHYLLIGEAILCCMWPTPNERHVDLTD